MQTREANLRGAVLGLSELIVAGDAYRLAAAEYFDLDVVETHAISYLDTYGPMTQTRLARLMGLTGGGVTGLVDRLEKAGTARRLPDPTDRRRNRVELTERATAIIDESREGLEHAFDYIEPAVLAVLVEALPMIAAGVNAQAQALRT